MDSYFRSVGFSRLRTKSQINKLNNEVLETPDSRYILSQNTDSIYIEYYKEYASNMGLSIKGIMDEKEDVIVKSLKPYLFTNHEINVSKIDIDVFDDEYIAVCQEEETGNEIVFYMQNALDFVDNEKDSEINKINVVGLSKQGTVILPIQKSHDYLDLKQKEDILYRDLVKKAKGGDNKAENKLKFYTEETNKIIQERLKDEDFLTVVESYFLPDYKEDAKYTILGDIISIKELSNEETNEKSYLFMLDITGTKLEICINENDLLGMPSVGMRFMGQCWLQGKVLY